MKIKQSYKLFAFTIFLLLLILGIFVFKALKSQNDVIRSEEHRFRSIMHAIELFQSSEDLTRMARSYVSTGNPIYEKKYFEILDIRNGKRPRPQKYDVTYWHLAGVEKGEAIAQGETVALQDLMRNEGYTEEEFNLLRESQMNSDHLVNMEKRAFAALNGLYDDGHGNFTVHRIPDRNYAVQLLFSEEYSNEKAKIMSPIQQFMDVLDQRTKNELSIDQSKLQQYILFALVFIIIVMIVVLIKIIHTFRRILYPIERLRNQVAEIASGNYAARCDIFSNNEIGELCANFNSMADFLQTDIAERKRIKYQVKERMKELQAFYHLSEITEREGITLEKLHQEFINILPQSWQYPEVCCARILISEDEFRTNNFKESTWIQSAPIKVYGSEVGRIDIGYLEEKPKEDEGPFLKEERLLINTIAERLGHITERKQAENRIKQSEEKLKEAQHIARMGNWELNLMENKLFWSDGIYKLFEIDPMKFGASYKAFLDMIHPDDREMVNQAYTESLKNRTPYEISHRLLMKDGRIKWVNEVCRTEYNKEGHPLKSFGIVQDITDRKRAEEALRKSSEMVKLLLNSTAEAIYGLDMKGNCTFNNSACLKILGYEQPEELLGKNMHEMIHSKYADGTPYNIYDCPIFNAFRSEKEIHVDNEVIWRKNGTSFPAEYWSYPVRQDGKLIGAVVTFLDITDRKKVENELRKLSRAVDQSPASIVITNTNGAIEYVNPKFIQLTGYSFEEAIGQNPRILKSGEKTSEEYKQLWNLVTSGKEWRGEFHNKRKNGELYWEFAVISPVMDEHGSITHFLAVKEDITERKQFELEREKLIKELRFALDNIKTLQGLIPICANCKKIRDDKGFWNQVEGYIMKHSDATFTHGVCPDCAKKLYGDLYEKVIKKPK